MQLKCSNKVGKSPDRQIRQCSSIGQNRSFNELSIGGISIVFHFATPLATKMFCQLCLILLHGISRQNMKAFFIYSTRNKMHLILAHCAKQHKNSKAYVAQRVKMYISCSQYNKVDGNGLISYDLIISTFILVF